MQKYKSKNNGQNKSKNKQKDKGHKKNQGLQTQVIASLVTCRDLVLLDPIELKKSEQKKCRDLYQKLEIQRQLLEEHEAKNEPEYHQWFQTHYGREMAEIRELGTKLSKLESLVEATERQSFIEECHPWEAYTKLLNLQAQREALYDKMREADESQKHAETEEEFLAARAKAQQEIREAQEEYRRTVFESLFGTKKDWRFTDKTYEEAYQEFKDQDTKKEKSRENHQQNQSGKKQRQQNQQNQQEKKKSAFGNEEQEMSAQDQVKELYHALAKKLHPDLNPGLDNRRLELWYQVQHAYLNYDLPTLKSLKAMQDLDDRSWEKAEEFSQLKNTFNQMARTQYQIEKKLKQAKQEKWWKFFDKLQDAKIIKKFQREIADDLRDQRDDFEMELEYLEGKVFQWELSAKMGRERRANKIAGKSKARRNINQKK
jgi:hypothetical protein